jgi:ABC-type multidrug transport system ATPase subunit
MDPSMRRALWTVISREREANDLCVLLTTHSMEEAEAICTKIGIMVKGQLKALGSNQHLKSRFGEGYSLRIDAETVDDVPKIQEFIQSIFPKSSMLEEYGRHLSYDVGVLESPASAFASIEKSKKKLSIANYSLSQTTLEQVFLRFACEDVEKKDAADL